MKKILSLLMITLILSPFIGGYAIAGLVVAGLALMTPEINGVAFMAIPAVDGRALFTKKTVQVYKEQISVKSFLRSFFTEVESLTKEVSIFVRRGTDKVAVDVSRHSDGNMNKFTSSTEKNICTTIL